MNRRSVLRAQAAVGAAVTLAGAAGVAAAAEPRPAGKPAGPLRVHVVMYDGVLDLALWLVRRELGADAATGVETMLEYEARGTVWTPPGAARR
ncbi:hypothetical protein ACIQZO_04645 [Streptomyces sp. NPDC097617]|uniref:hypothetical protein n=1 Tax=Streptomyces sp. NPDC097617 TaxID=3366091 RepID=UPI00381E80DD